MRIIHCTMRERGFVLLISLSQLTDALITILTLGHVYAGVSGRVIAWTKLRTHGITL